MKLLELDFIAFGPFTDVRLDMTAGAQRLHVVFGPNEAGKSSALRGLQALLYGIPHDTADNFLHDNPRLRIGGGIRHSDSSELRFVRRKGYKNTLLTPDNQPLPDSALGTFLGGVGRELFATMFGIDHATLVRGGQEILRGGGDVGQSLFAAGLGGISLRQVLQGLDAEAEQLFRPRGQNYRINKALADYQAVKRTVSESSVSSREWSDHDKTFHQATADLRKVRDAFERFSQEQQRLKRFQSALPKIAQRQELLAKLQALGDVVLLPSDFPGQRRETVQKLEAAVGAERETEQALQRLHQDLQGLAVPEALLEQAETIVALHERLGSHRKAAQDRPGLVGEQRQLEVDAERLLGELRPELTLAQAKGLRLQAGHRARIDTLAGQYQADLERVHRARNTVQEHEDQRTRVNQELNALEVPRDSQDLRRAVTRAQRQGDMEGELAQARMARQVEEEQAQIELKQLGLTSATIEELELLPIPAHETLDRFETDINALGAKKVRLEERMGEVRAELAEVERDLEELRLAGTVPSEEELSQSRVTRDELWTQVRDRWTDRHTLARAPSADDAEENLLQRYENSVSHADELADRLRREAERVARQATLMARRAQGANELEQLDGEKATLQAQIRQLHEAWNDLWQPLGIRPLPPREMRAWVDRHEKLLQRAERVRECRRKVQGLHARVDEHRTEVSRHIELISEVGAMTDETLEALLARSECLLESIDATARKRQELQTEVGRLQQRLQRAQRDQQDAADKLSQWQRDWAAAVADLGLGGEALPPQANAVLSTLDELLKKLDEADRLAQRIRGIDRDAAAFATDVNALVERVAPDLLEVPPDHAVGQLHDRLSRAQASAATKAEIQKQIQEKDAALEEAQTTIRLLRERLAALCRQARCSTADDLPAAEERSGQTQALHKDLETVEQHLLELSAGATLDQLLREAGAVDADAIPAHLEGIEHQVQELEDRRSALDQTIGQERTILKQMDGSAKAAESAEKAEAILADLRGAVDRFVRLRLASVILRQEIERYRTSHQEPLLARASELFRQLTLGSFERLQADFNDQDQPILVGVRPSGDLVVVEGMSDGTRDQLFLALRLASLEHYLATNEPLPFIVDDILIQFDDQRAEATLQVLAQLSAKTQVIFFTHHGGLVEAAQRVTGDGAMTIHRLGLP